MTNLKKALREAYADTFIGMLINIPLNYILLLIASKYSFGILLTTIFITAIFTAVAITRKTYIRLKFAKRYENEKE